MSPNPTAPPQPPPPPGPPGGQSPPQPGGQTPPQPGGQRPPQPGGQTPPQPGGQTPPNPNGGASQQKPPQPGGQTQPGQQGGATTPGSGAILTFQMKAIQQTERKTLTFEYHRSQAVTRQYAPQALFGLLTEVLSGPGHFLEVDLDDPFFRSLDVEVELMAELAPYGLRSVAVSLDYGDTSDPQKHRHDDFVFDAADSAAKHWIVPIGADFDLGYTPRVEYHFDPQSDWVGEANEVVYAPGRVEDRTLQLDPTAHVGFLDVEVRPERLDAIDVTSVEVELSHTSPSGWTTSKSFVVTPTSAAQHWTMRTSARDNLTYSVQRTYHLTDGGTVRFPATPSSASAVAVSSPFAARLERRVDFAIAAGAVKSAIVDLAYDDVERGHTVRRRVELDGAALTTTRLQFGIVDPLLRTTSTAITLIGADGAVTRGPAFDGEAEFLTVAPDATITGA